MFKKVFLFVISSFFLLHALAIAQDLSSNEALYKIVKHSRIYRDGIVEVQLGQLPEALRRNLSQMRVAGASGGNPIVFVLTTGFSSIIKPQYLETGLWSVMSSFTNRVYFYVVLVSLEEKPTSVTLWWDIESMTGGKNLRVHRSVNLQPLKLTGYFLQRSLRSSVDLYSVTAQIGKPLPANPIDLAVTKFIAGN